MKDVHSNQGTRRTPLSDEQFAQASLALVQRWRRSFQADRLAALSAPIAVATAPAPTPAARV